MAMGNKEKPILFPASKVLGYGGEKQLIPKKQYDNKK